MQPILSLLVGANAAIAVLDEGNIGNAIVAVGLVVLYIALVVVGGK